MPSHSQILPIRIYTMDQIQTAIIDNDNTNKDFQKDLIDGIRDGFVALEHGQFYAPPIQTLGLPPFEFSVVFGGGMQQDTERQQYAAQTCIKTGYFQGAEHYVVKVASGGYPLESTYERKNERTTNIRAQFPLRPFFLS